MRSCIASLLACAALLSINQVQVRAFSASGSALVHRTPTRAHCRSGRGLSVVRLRMHLDGKQKKEQYNEQDKEQQDGMPRRQLFRMAAVAVVGLGVLPVAPALAVRQSKEELMTQAKVIQKEVKQLTDGAVMAEADWETKDRLEAQREYNALQSILKGGQLSQLRGTCFHLYRDHIVNAAQYKQAEKAYKDMLVRVEKLNLLLLKASRDELKSFEEIKAIQPALKSFSEQLDVFVGVVETAFETA